MENNINIKSYIVVCLLIIIIGIFYCVTVREGLNWDGDHSQYIHHAKNIAEGKPYKDTGYIHNPSNPGIGPIIYPPVFPMLLAPVYLVAGINFKLMKIVTIYFFLFSLYIIFLNFKDELPIYYVILILGLIGFNYYFWDFKDQILSDLPFLLFIYTCFYFAVKTYEVKRISKQAVVLASLTGLFLYLSYGTRSIGIVLLPAIFLYEILNYKKVSFKTIVIFFVFLSFAVFQNISFHADASGGSYLDRLYFDTTIPFNNFKIYTRDASALWQNGYSSVFKKIIFLVFSLCSLSGFIIRLRTIGIHEIFFGSYLVVILIWPGNQGTRFLIPLIPLYIFYFFYFINFLKIQFLNNKNLSKATSLILFIVISSISFSYGLLYYKKGFKPIYHGVHKAASIELFSYIKNNTATNDVIIFRKPRILALFTSRSSACYHFSENDKELWNYFKEIGVTYLIEEKIFQNDFSLYFRSYIEKNKSKLLRVFSNSDFNIYRIK